MLQIPVGVNDDEREELLNSMVMEGEGDEEGGGVNPRQRSSAKKSFLARAWSDFDKRFLKPTFTSAQPTLMETAPDCCLSDCLTSSQQMSQRRSAAEVKAAAAEDETATSSLNSGD